MTRIFKFGGALMIDPEGIERVATILKNYEKDTLVVVVSALGKTTNALEELLVMSRKNETQNLEVHFRALRQAHFAIVSGLLGDEASLKDELDKEFQLLWEALKRKYHNKYEAYDEVVSFGEIFSSLILHAYLEAKGILNQLIDARSVVVTDNNHTDAAINWEMTGKTIQSRVSPVLEQGLLVLTQGFIGCDGKGNFTTLGREGSDFTAAVFGCVLEAEEVSIWKDVPGLMNCDPKKFDEAVQLPQISYHEAIELAFYGASVIHPKTIQPLQQKNIPLFVRSFYHPENPASRISDDASHDSDIHKVIIKNDQVLLSIGSRNLSFIAEKNLTEIFKAFSRNKIHLNLMQNSAVSFSVCFNLDEDKLQGLLRDLKDKYLLRYNKDLQLLTLRHYNTGVVEKLTAGKKIFLEQKSRTTLQFLVRD